jgi:ParB family chromosome partitioning protein
MLKVSEKKGGLGRGLNALLSQTAYLSNEQARKDTAFKKIPVNQLCPGKYQPRKHVSAESLQELADSIQQQGVVQPIIVRPIGYEQYEIIAGERRWRASQMAKLTEVPVVVYEIEDAKALAFSLIENIQREDLNPMEEAYALHRLIEEFGLSHQQTAEAVGKSRTAVTNMLRLLHLADEVKRWVEERQLEMGHARALLTLSAAEQCEVAKVVINRGLSVRETEALVKKYRQSVINKKVKDVESMLKDPNLSHFQTELSERLGAKVVINHTKKGKGSLVIYYNSLGELDGIIEHIG